MIIIIRGSSWLLVGAAFLRFLQLMFLKPLSSTITHRINLMMMIIIIILLIIMMIAKIMMMILIKPFLVCSNEWNWMVVFILVSWIKVKLKVKWSQFGMWRMWIYVVRSWDDDDDDDDDNDNDCDECAECDDDEAVAGGLGLGGQRSNANSPSYAFPSLQPLGLW